jgi:murein tripeptide amidase MpaA
MPYLNVTEVESALQNAANQYPGFIQRFQLPNNTPENRTCHAVKIGSGAGCVGVYFIAGVHAREWACPDTLIYFTEQLAQAYQANSGITLGSKSFTAAQVQSIVNKLDIFVFPQVNPDGRNYSMTSDISWRKNRRPAPSSHPSSCIGVDVNRNYDFLWDYLNYFDPLAPVHNSTSPCDSTYIGPSAVSEPENKNVVWVLDNYPNIRFFVDVHSYGEKILRGWGDDEEQTTDSNMNFQNSTYDNNRGIAGDAAYKEHIQSDDQALSISLANGMRDAIKAVRNRTYTVQSSFALYPTAGTSTDYIFSRHIVDSSKPKVKSFTIECGTTFWPSDTERQEIRKEVTAGLLEFCLEAMEACADIYIRDNLQDTGQEPLVGGGLARSPDINHYRNQLANPQAILGSASAQGQNDLFEDVEYGQPNYIYIRLQNRGTSTSGANVDIYWTRPSTLPTPNSWNLIGSIDVPSVAPGEFKVAGPLTWSTVPSTGHYCFVAVLGNVHDPKPDKNMIQNSNDFYTYIRENNNVAWKNFDVKDMFSGSVQRFAFQVQGWPRIAYLSDLEIDLSNLPRNVQVELQILKRLTEGTKAEHLSKTKETKLYSHYKATPPERVALRNMPLKTSDNSQATVYITLPEDIPDGAYDFSVLQKIEGKEMGRVTKRILVGEHPYVANRNSGEVHIANCEWVKKMSSRNKIAYRELELALKHGYNGCYYCLPEFDTG